jgi:hypothetical protein
MSETATTTPAFHEGLNDPSPIDRVIVFGWYDGPTAGVLQLGEDGPVYRFALLDEGQLAEDENDLRAYGLYSLPADAWSRLVTAVSPYMAPRWPVWVPLWRFPSDEIRQTVERETDQVLASAGPLSWVIVGELGTGSVRALPVRASLAS